MPCKYEDPDGWCTGKYRGFACIEDRCPLFLEEDTSGDECEYSVNNGFYCRKYSKFYCAGIGNCDDADNYFRMLVAYEKKLKTEAG